MQRGSFSHRTATCQKLRPTTCSRHPEPSACSTITTISFNLYHLYFYQDHRHQALNLQDSTLTRKTSSPISSLILLWPQLRSSLSLQIRTPKGMSLQSQMSLLRRDLDRRFRILLKAGKTRTKKRRPTQQEEKETTKFY